MKWLAQPEHLKPKRFMIEQDPTVGFYIYVFEGEKCIQDQLQDTFELAVASVMEDYDVPKDAWREAED